MPLLTDEEIEALVARFDAEPIDLADLLREAVRLAGERAAGICEARGESLAAVVKDHDDEDMADYRKARAWDCLLCAAAIREASK